MKTTFPIFPLSLKFDIKKNFKFVLGRFSEKYDCFQQI